MFSFLLILILDMQSLLFAFQYNHTQSLKQLTALKNSESKQDNKLRTCTGFDNNTQKTFHICIF